MSSLRYPCLVLDHDDTVVDSTAHIHFPAFLEGVRVLRPGSPALSMTLEEYFHMNYSPGLMRYYRETLGFDDSEIEQESKSWLNYVASHIPTAFDGIGALLEEQKRRGGWLCVVSHSRRENILRDYAENGLPKPDLVYGSELPKDRWKPSPWPLLDIAARLRLSPDQLLVVDDLPLGLEMAQAAGAHFAAACWAHAIPELQAVMVKNNVRRFFSPAALHSYLFG